MQLLQKVGLIVAGAALALVAFFGINATFAQETDEETESPAIILEEGVFPGHGLLGDHREALADALGITVEELQTAQAEARQAMVDAAVAEGRLTEEQASHMQARQALHGYIDHDMLLERVTGMTSEELTTALQAEAEAALQQAVADGVITQEQADQIDGLPFGWRGMGHRHAPRLFDHWTDEP